MTDFNKILDKAKEIEAQMKLSQEKIKDIRAEGLSGANSVKVILNGEGEMIKVELSREIIKEEKSIIEDLIIAAHNNAKALLKSKTSEEIAKVTTAVPLTDELKVKVLAKVKELTGKDAEIQSTVDESILGGFILRVGDIQYDASIANKLDKLKREFTLN